VSPLSSRKRVRQHQRGIGPHRVRNTQRHAGNKLRGGQRGGPRDRRKKNIVACDCGGDSFSRTEGKGVVLIAEAVGVQITMDTTEAKANGRFGGVGTKKRNDIRHESERLQQGF